MIPMPIARWDVVLGLIVLVVVALVVVAVAWSVRTRRSGLGLTLLLCAVAVVYVAGIASNGALLADPDDYLSPHRFLAGLGPGLATLTDLFLFALSGLVTLVVVAVARRWIWLAAVGISLLPLPGLALIGLLPTDPLAYVHDLVPFTAALFFPVLVGLVYALSPHHRQRRNWDAYTAWPPHDVAP